MTLLYCLSIYVGNVLVTCPCLVLVSTGEGSIHRAAKHASMWQVGDVLSIVLLLTLRGLHRNPKLLTSLINYAFTTFCLFYIIFFCLNNIYSTSSTLYLSIFISISELLKSKRRAWSWTRTGFFQGEINTMCLELMISVFSGSSPFISPFEVIVSFQSKQNINASSLPTLFMFWLLLHEVWVINISLW